MATKPVVAIIGDGNVGSAIAKGLKTAGYSVQAVGKEPARVREIGRGAQVVILAVPFGERRNALNELGDVKGKVLVDVTNNLTEKMGYGGTLDQSGAEELQSWAKDAKVVKAFNTVFAQHMSTGRVDQERLTLLVAGDDAKAKQAVIGLGKDIGFDATDAGPLANARWLEVQGFFHVVLAYGQKLGTFGLRLVGLSQKALVAQTAAGRN
jgi:predicted dinucleotide-binding enzyme